MKPAFIWLTACGFGFFAGAALAAYGLWVAVQAIVPEPTPETAGASSH